MLNEVRRKPEKPRMYRFTGTNWAVECPAVIIVAPTPDEAYLHWKDWHEQKKNDVAGT